MKDVSSKKETKKKLSIIMLCISACYMLFIFAPLEIFVPNTKEFWFDIFDLLPIIIGCFIVVLFLSAGLLLLIKKKLSENAYRNLLSISVCGFVGLYIQGNYIPRDYGVLDGSEINWSSYTGYAIASIILWLFVFFSIVILILKYKKYVYKVSLIFSSIVIIMLSMALIFLFGNSTDLVKRDNFIVTDKNEFEFAEGKNIVILCLDSFDSLFMRDVLSENYGKYSEMLEDFTFYPNSVGSYASTKGSVPLLLTGEWYENDMPFEEYIQNAYQKTDLYGNLKENQYSVGLYANSLFVNKSQTYDNIFQGKNVITDYTHFIKSIYRMVAFNYMPHHLKKYFEVYSGVFENYRKISDTIDGLNNFTDLDDVYYKKLKSEGISINSKYTNSFKYIHLEGTHLPYSFGENVIKDGREYSSTDSAKGNLTIVNELLTQLKEKGLYNNTAIFIIADHGLRGEPYINCSPIVLVKNYNERHEFRISNNPVSSEDLVPSLNSVVTGNDSPNAYWNQRDTDRKRRYMVYNWGEKGNDWLVDYLPDITEYVISGDISTEDFKMEQTGLKYKSIE